MRDVLCMFLAVACVFTVNIYPVCASDGDDIEPIVVEEVDVPEEDVTEEIEMDNSSGDYYDKSHQIEFYSQLLQLLDERLPLGYSGEEIEQLPPIHELMGSSFGISLASIGTQTAYPYTGGAYMALNTNYGNGLMIVPEPFKADTFGFVKGSDRVVNLTNATINAYWIMGGTTYSARFQRYGEAEYAYVSGGTTTWRAMTVSAMTDTNIQFLDETGERGIQRPYFPLESKFFIALILILVFTNILSLFARRR